MICLGVIGFGYWGPQLVRNFLAAGVHRVTVCDRSVGRLAAARSLYPGIQTTIEPEAVLADDALDAIAIATPVSTHYALALAALRAGKHVWLEKPMAQTVEECAHLLEEAAQRERILMVDFPYVFSPSVLAMRELLRRGKLGRLYYFDSVRTNLGRFQPDVDVLGDLASHDLSILDFLLEEAPCTLSVTGAAHVAGEPTDLAYLTLSYPEGFLAHVQVNWLAPCKVRRAMMVGSRRMILWDDLIADEKLKVYDRGIKTPRSTTGLRELRIGYRTGEVRSPHLDTAEPLQLAAAHFLDCVITGSQPRTPGETGLRIARWLEAARESLTAGGRPVELCLDYADACPHASGGR